MQNTKMCPICEKDVFSDVDIKEFCALCGMNIKDKPTITERFGETNKHFCCIDCYNKYNKFHKN